MARMHILQSAGTNLYNVLVHSPTPAGNNFAGVPWNVALQNAGLARSSMTVGNGAGQITNAENNNVNAGTIFEANFIWQNDPAWTSQQRTDDLNLRATQAVTELTTEYAARLAFFGATVT